MIGRGTLVLVATPIGNLGDLAPAAIEELARADVVCCEDTRRTGRLLQHAGVRARELCLVNDHTEYGAIPKLLDRLDAGERIAIVTDAGTPGISDPGERLVAAAAAAGHAVLVVPGPSAVIAALVASGLPTARFVFEGFLPRKGVARDQRLRELASEPRTVVCYEAPHRVARTLTDLADAFGSTRRVAIARELTKLHEEVWRGTLADAVEWAANEPRGEIVLVIDGAPAAAPPDEDALLDALRAQLVLGATVKDASTEVATRFGVSRRAVYELAHTLPPRATLKGSALNFPVRVPIQRDMTRKVWLPVVACALTSLVTACSGSGSDVRQTAFPADTGTSASAVSFDQKATWSCKDADLQAVFAPAFSGDSLVAAIKSAIADPAKADAEFSFVAPINSFFTSFETNALCLTIAGDTSSAEAASLVSQLRASGNVVSVRRR